MVGEEKKEMIWEYAWCSPNGTSSWGTQREGKGYLYWRVFERMAYAKVCEPRWFGQSHTYPHALLSTLSVTVSITYLLCLVFYFILFFLTGSFIGLKQEIKHRVLRRKAALVNSSGDPVLDIHNLKTK